MRDIQRIVTERLRNEGIDNPLRLRIFDESNDDARLWNDGGLTFTTSDGKKAGSSDGAWYIEKSWTDPISKVRTDCTPILVVEGTFGTETGNVGDAQKTKLSHVIDLPQRGILAAILMPEYAEYYTSGKGKKTHTIKKMKQPPKDYPRPTYVTAAKWYPSLVLVGLNVSKTEKGRFLFIDAYDKKQLEDLVYSLAKWHAQGNPQTTAEVNKQIKKILSEMKLYTTKYSNDPEKPRNNNFPLVVLDLPMEDGEFSKEWIGKIHSHDVKAFGITTGTNEYATSRHRNQHILIGNVIELNQLRGKKIYLILPRINKNDLERVRNEKTNKEFVNLDANKDFDFVTLDDIDFGTDTELRDEFVRIREVGIKLDAKLGETDSKKMTDCCIKLKWGLYQKKYKIKK